MSRREDIDNAIWSDPDFEALSIEATCLYLWSFTNPRCGMAGLYKVSRRAMTESKLADGQLDAAVAELAAARFMFYETGVLFVRTRVKHMRQKTEQIAKSIRADLAKVSDGHPLWRMWVDENAGAAWLVKFLGPGWELPEPDPQPTVTGGSPEPQAFPSPKPFSRSSSEGHPTLKGNGKGNGSGKGKGTLGGKTEKGLRWRAWAAEHVNDLPAEFVAVTAEALSSAGRDIDGDVVRRAVLARYPSLRASA